MPQNAIAMPYLLQVSITCASRMEPPGCTMAVTPAAARALDVIAEREEGITAQAHTGHGIQPGALFLGGSAGPAAR